MEEKKRKKEVGLLLREDFEGLRNPKIFTFLIHSRLTVSKSRPSTSTRSVINE